MAGDIANLGPIALALPSLFLLPLHPAQGMQTGRSPRTASCLYSWVVSCVYIALQ